MKQQFTVLLALTCIAFCINHANADTTTNAMIRVLSYNIHHGVGIDKKLDLERIAKVIKSASPDIVSLQEVDQIVGRSDGIDQAKELARLTNMNFVFGSAIKLGRGHYGNAVLTKLPIEESETISLPGQELRSALCVTLRTSDKSSAGKFLFIATHLDNHRKESRIKSASLIEELFDSDKNLPAILAGDLNTVHGSPVMMAVEKTWSDATNKKDLFTAPAKNPFKQIDYILCRPLKRWKVLETKVLDEAVASDHRPILAVLQLNPDFAPNKTNP